MIQIYNKGNKDYSKNGDMTLFPIVCELEAELNGAWELTLEHPIDSLGRWKTIVEDAVIQCNTFMPEPQRFRIYEKRKSNNGVIAYARPIFQDTKDIVLIDVRPTQKSGQEALDIILDGTGFLGKSDITDKRTTYLQRKNIPDILLGKNENSFVNRWGGEAIYDNETVIMNKRAGGDYGVSCKFGKNLEEIEETINLDGVITRIIPVSYKGHMLDGDEPWVDSPNIDKYATVHAREVRFKDIYLAEDREGGYQTLAELQAALKTAAEEMFTVQKVDEPAINYVVNMVDLAKTLEYRNYECLETVGLGDTIKCSHKNLGIEVEARAIRVVYDCIQRKNLETELGNYQSDYFSQLQDLSDRVRQTTTPSGTVKADAIQGIIDCMKTQLRAQRSVEQTQQVRAMLFEDLDPESPTYGAMSIGTMGFEIAAERTVDGRDWDWRTFGTAKGFTADLIHGGTITASMFYCQGVARKYAADYSDDDLTRIREIFMNGEEATIEELERYDLNADGTIDSGDSMKLQQLLNGTYGEYLDIPIWVRIDPADTLYPIKMKKVALGPGGGRIENIASTHIRSKQFSAVDSTGGSEYLGVNGTFTDGSGRTVTVKSGLITEL